MTSWLAKVNKSLGAHFHMLFSKIVLFLMFLNIQIDLIILKTDDKQFTLTTKKSLHITFRTQGLLFAVIHVCKIYTQKLAHTFTIAAHMSSTTWPITTTFATMMHDAHCSGCYNFKFHNNYICDVARVPLFCRFRFKDLSTTTMYIPKDIPVYR